MTWDEQQQFVRILNAHAQTLQVCEACATTTRDLAEEVKRGSIPARDDLQRTVDTAEDVLLDLAATGDEIRRLLREFAV